jgi:peptidoglycan/xylan/chitin deacetylase (PgdA/CDA1 family)
LKKFLLIQPRSLLKRVYPRAIWNFGRDKKNIYLTFDDGPIPGLTEWVLDELRKQDVRATFFCVGDNIIKYPGIYERVQKEGHRVANHTMHHPIGFKRNVSAYLKEVEDCASLVQNKLFRPPYGQLSPGQYKGLIRRGYRIIFWDVISYDYEPISPEQCTRNVMRNTKPGSIVLFHDNIKAEQNVKHTLPLFISHFKELGYSFKTL